MERRIIVADPIGVAAEAAIWEVLFAPIPESDNST